MADQRILRITIIIRVHDCKSRFIISPAKFSTLIPPSQPNVYRFNKIREKSIQWEKKRSFC